MSDLESNSPVSSVETPQAFEQLAESRRHWIETVLRPWCHQAGLKQLRQAEVEWHDIAGRVDINATLWTWAWERFPVLTHDDMPGVNETYEVQVTLMDGRVIKGFPDSRLSTRGTLVLIGQDDSTDRATTEFGPFKIDQVSSVSAVSESIEG